MVKTIEDFQEELQSIGSAQSETSLSYLGARRRYASARSYIWLELSKDIIRYRSEKSNIGVDMAILTKLAEAQKQKDTDFLEMYDQYESSEAEYKGLEKVLNSQQNRAIGLQSVMKYTLSGEVYGKNDQQA